MIQLCNTDRRSEERRVQRAVSARLIEREFRDLAHCAQEAARECGAEGLTVAHITMRIMPRVAQVLYRKRPLLRISTIS